ncbi:MAG: GSU3473 family protein [Geobacteraceae bacterium]
MMIRVIYKDQTAGVIESHFFDDLIAKGRIVAYHSVDRWVPVHSKAARSGTTAANSPRYLDEPGKCNPF